MDENLRRLAYLIGPCPECGNGRLDAVSDGEITNFVCRDCANCWHPEHAWVHRVDPATCPGCPAVAVCQGARRSYGAPSASRRRATMGRVAAGMAAETEEPCDA